MTDAVAAVDAAAHAAVAYRRDGLRGTALGCAARAEALADHGGVDTPTLRQAREPLPITDREREIVLLISQGLSSRDVAERLDPFDAHGRGTHLPGDGEDRHSEP